MTGQDTPEPTPSVWGSRPTPAPLTDPRMNLHLGIIRAIATAHDSAACGNGPYVEDDTVTFIVPGSHDRSTRVAAKVIADLTEYGYPAATDGTRTDGTRVTIDTTNLPRDAYDTLPARARTIWERCVTAQAENSWWGSLAEDETDDWHYLGEVLSLAAEADPGRYDIHALMRDWMRARPNNVLPNRDVFERTQEHLSRLNHWPVTGSRS